MIPVTRSPPALDRLAGPAGPMIEEADVHALLPGIEAPETARLIALLRDAVTAQLDGWAGLLGRQIITATWRLRLPRFPYRDRYGNPWAAIDLPLPRLQTVLSVTFVDPDGIDRHLGDGDWHIVDGGHMPSSIMPADGADWPETAVRPDAVTITFTAGYGDTPADVPANLRLAAAHMIADGFEHRGMATPYALVPNETALGLLKPFMVPRCP